MFLRGIWYLSAGLAATAVIVMVVLIVLRIVTEPSRGCW
jgi:hypothetical protein